MARQTLKQKILDDIKWAITEIVEDWERHPTRRAELDGTVEYITLKPVQEDRQHD